MKYIRNESSNAVPAPMSHGPSGCGQNQPILCRGLGRGSLRIHSRTRFVSDLILVSQIYDIYIVTEY